MTTLLLKIKKVKLSARTIIFVNEDSYHLLFYSFHCNVCFFTKELQEYQIYLGLQNIHEDLRKAVGDDPMPFTFDELLNWAQPLVMVINHCNKSPEMIEVLKNEWEAKCDVKIALYLRAIKINWMKKRQKTVSDDATMDKIVVEINRL